jgi:hypothetical protein
VAGERRAWRGSDELREVGFVITILSTLLGRATSCGEVLEALLDPRPLILMDARVSSHEAAEPDVIADPLHHL